MSAGEDRGATSYTKVFAPPEMGGGGGAIGLEPPEAWHRCENETRLGNCAATNSVHGV